MMGSYSSQKIKILSKKARLISIDWYGGCMMLELVNMHDYDNNNDNDNDWVLMVRAVLVTIMIILEY
jgi:hypothetical protein